MPQITKIGWNCGDALNLIYIAVSKPSLIIAIQETMVVPGVLVFGCISRFAGGCAMSSTRFLWTAQTLSFSELEQFETCWKFCRSMTLCSWNSNYRIISYSLDDEVHVFGLKLSTFPFCLIYLSLRASYRYLFNDLFATGISLTTIFVFFVPRIWYV